MKPLCSIGLIAIAACFFVPVSISVDVEFWRTLMDVMHLPVFAVVCGLCFPFFNARGDDAHLRNCRNAFVAACVLSIGVELLQPFTGRSQSLLDQIYGMAGAAFGAFFIFVWPRRKEPSSIMVLLAAVIAAGVAVMGPPIRKYRTIEHRLAQFPVLGSFEDAEDLSLWRPNYFSFTGEGRYRISTNYVSQGEFSQKVVAAEGGWPGVSFDAGDQDWSGQRTFAFDLFNPTSEFLLFLRIDDDGGVDGSPEGRFDQDVLMKKGWNYVRLPVEQIGAGTKGRTLNLKAVRRIVLFIDASHAPRTFFLDNIHLTTDVPNE